MKCTRCNYKVSGIILLYDLKGTMQPDCRKKRVCACFNSHQLQFQHIKASYVEVVVLIGCVSRPHPSECFLEQ